ncbi:MAG TPA: hypothetical protein VMT95_05430 [Candidatus Binatia bacterium]|nr:hypothetical protein [Candidatus Binatia bacterium]
MHVAQRAFLTFVAIMSFTMMLARSGTVDRTWHSIGPGSINAPKYGWASGRVSQLIVDDDGALVVATANGGIWRRAASDQGWSETNAGLQSLAFGAIDHRRKLYVAATGEDHNCTDCAFGEGVYKSNDGGRSWTFLPRSPPMRAAAIRIGSSDGQVIWLAGSTGLWESINGGTSWSESAHDGGTEFIDPTSVLVLPGDKTVIVGDRTGLFRKTKDDTDWKLLNVNPVADLQQYDSDTGVESALAVAESDPSEILASFVVSNTNYDYGCLAGLFISHNTGDTWTQIDVDDYANSQNFYTHVDPTDSSVGCQGWYDDAVAINPTNPQDIAVGGLTIFRSFDGGRSWTNLARANGIHPDVHTLTYDTTGDLYAGEDGGVVEFPANGSPLNLNQHLAITQFYGDASLSGDGTIVDGTQDNGTTAIRGTLQSLAQAPTPAWTGVFGGDGGNTIIDPHDSQAMYAEHYNGTLFSTTDGGANWKFIGPPVTAVDWVMPFLVTTDWQTILAGGDNVYRTTTGGQGGSAWTSLGPWAEPSPHTSADPYITALWASSDGKMIVAGRTDGQLAKMATTSQWLKPPQTIGSGRIASIAVDPRDHRHAFVSLADPSRCSIEETADFDAVASQWKDVTGDLKDCKPIALQKYDWFDTRTAALAFLSDRLFVGTESGVFEETSPSHWCLLGDGLPHVPIKALLFVPPQSLVAFTHGRGAWYLSDITMQCQVR